MCMPNFELSLFLSLLALGCPTVEAPPHVIVQQTHDLVKFKCRDTGEQWYQNCKHNVWVGTENNCSYFAGR